MYDQVKAPTATCDSPSAHDSGPVEAEPSNSASLQAAGVHAEFDTVTHERVGDSVSGESVAIGGVVFTPGEINALADFVGSPVELASYPTETLQQMKARIDLPAPACEDAAAWDALTNGGYSKLARDNESHFAPGGEEGADFESSFVLNYSQALYIAQQAAALDGQEADDKMTEARTLAYFAEHFLEDAFAAGHQVAATDVGAAVGSALGGERVSSLAPEIAKSVFATSSASIGQYESLGLAGWRALTTAEAFAAVVEEALLVEGQGLLEDAVRKFVHEQLSGKVEVASPHHPEPWVLSGDSGLDGGGDSAVTLACLGDALSDVRSTLEIAMMPGWHADSQAQKVFDLHRPVPTGAGQRVVDQTLAHATEDARALVASVSAASAAEIDAILESLAATMPNVRKRAAADVPGFGADYTAKLDEALNVAA
jgi:hypothetical protein